MKQILLFVFLSLFLTSCKDYSKTIPDEQELLRKELHTINWNEVDVYPTYANCDTIEDVQKNLACFFYIFNEDLSGLLRKDSLLQTPKFYSLDSLPIEVTVYPNAAVELKLHKNNAEVEPEIVGTIDSLLFIKSAQLQPIQPAIKRDVPVKTKFLVKVGLHEQFN